MKSKTGILARNKKQLTYIYSSESYLGKQVLGYIQGTQKKIESIDIVKENLGNAIWVELADKLNVPLGELFAKDTIDSSKTENSEDFDTDDWLKLVNKNPELLQRPIVVNGDKVMLISHRSEILQFFGVDSAGLEKTMSHESPTISSTTKDENFI
jgi:arsenate reductase